MARDPIYRAGDRLEDGQGNVAYVNAYTSAEKGTVYLRARFAHGPRTGEFVWPERVGLPIIDWDRTGVATVCRECDRTFKAGIDTGGLPHVLCRTCTAIEARTDRHHAGDTVSHQFGSQRRRVFRR